MSLCVHCSEELSISVYKFKKGIMMKSCPSCSKSNGKYHVFYEYDEFGFTDRRIGKQNPSGIQSHCVECRERGVTSGQTLCYEK